MYKNATAKFIGMNLESTTGNTYSTSKVSVSTRKDSRFTSRMCHHPLEGIRYPLGFLYTWGDIAGETRGLPLSISYRTKVLRRL